MGSWWLLRTNNLVRMSRLIVEQETKVPVVAWPSLGEVRLYDTA